jgi:hypothetical protein
MVDFDKKNGVKDNTPAILNLGYAGVLQRGTILA